MEKKLAAPGPAPLALNVDNVERSFRQALQGHHIPCPVTHFLTQSLWPLNVDAPTFLYVCRCSRLLAPPLSRADPSLRDNNDSGVPHTGSPTGWKLGLPVCQQLYQRWNMYAATSRIYAERYDRSGLVRFYWLYTNSYVR